MRGPPEKFSITGTRQCVHLNMQNLITAHDAGIQKCQVFNFMWLETLCGSTVTLLGELILKEAKTNTEIFE